MQTQGKCENCQKDDPIALTAIGEPVLKATKSGRRSVGIEYIFAQCPQCGSVWVLYDHNGEGDDSRKVCLSKEFF
jgi:hypothetical protein